MPVCLRCNAHLSSKRMWSLHPVGVRLHHGIQGCCLLGRAQRGCPQRGWGKTPLKSRERVKFRVFSGNVRVFSGCFQGVFPHPFWTLNQLRASQIWGAELEGNEPTNSWKLTTRDMILGCAPKFCLAHVVQSRLCVPSSSGAVIDENLSPLCLDPACLEVLSDKQRRKKNNTAELLEENWTGTSSQWPPFAYVRRLSTIRRRECLFNFSEDEAFGSSANGNRRTLRSSIICCVVNRSTRVGLSQAFDKCLHSHRVIAIAPSFLFPVSLSSFLYISFFLVFLYPFCLSSPLSLSLSMASPIFRSNEMAHRCLTALLVSVCIRPTTDISHHQDKVTVHLCASWEEFHERHVEHRSFQLVQMLCHSGDTEGCMTWQVNKFPSGEGSSLISLSLADHSFPQKRECSSWHEASTAPAFVASGKWHDCW